MACPTALTTPRRPFGYLVEFRAQGTRAPMLKLWLLILLWVIKLIVLDPGVLCLLWESMELWQANLWAHIVISMWILLLLALNHTYLSSVKFYLEQCRFCLNQSITDKWLYWPEKPFCILIIAEGKDRGLVASQNDWPCLFISPLVICVFLDMTVLS